MELWQTAVQELERLQQVYQKTVSEGKIHDAQRQQLKVQSLCINMQRQHVTSCALQTHQLYTTRWSYYGYK